MCDLMGCMGDEGIEWYGMDREVYQALIAEGWTPPRALRARAGADGHRQPPGRHVQEDDLPGDGTPPSDRAPRQKATWPIGSDAPSPPGIYTRPVRRQKGQAAVTRHRSVTQDTFFHPDGQKGN